MRGTDNKNNSKGSSQVTKKFTAKESINFKDARPMTKEDMVINNEGHYVIPNGSIDYEKNCRKEFNLPEASVFVEGKWTLEDDNWKRN